MSNRHKTLSEVITGKTLTKIVFDSDQVEFFWEGGSAKFLVDGDCCSKSWIDSFDGHDDILGQEIVAVKDLDLPIDMLGRETDDDGNPKKMECGCKNREMCAPDSQWNHDCLRFYGYRIETDGASATLDFRNDSNGYYGGSLDYYGPEED